MGLVNTLLKYTYSDYLGWEGRWELINGHPIDISPSPVPLHQVIAENIAYEFGKAIREAKCKHCKVVQALDYKISEETVICPDVLIMCKPAKKKFLDFSPSLVVEILSPSTALRDRNIKFNIYE
ncbi:Uma2 family endonuclease [Parasediminibacterium sp. JCM 36343]|uniref:Uma2 family endonuclease n=1 Tax=Parasediminibacterium sp. JCM 36343 TaxID=3374279 RepID=UPI003979E6D0